ncbi:MAG: adenylate/guanylate cyclase domain-containing protein [Planctomycetes bacterium]|nr:adenylate/guanylate cyclase domain-containing protein [Planctomycetota bacterium]
MNKVLTIMFTDIKGFTERTSSQSREHLTNLLKTHDDLVAPVITKFGGKVIKTIGDAFMAAFESPTNAVLCAMLIQHKMKEYNLTAPDDAKILVRVALNAGEVQIQDKDLFGEAVNIAARIEGITEANEIYFTEAVYLAMNKSEVPSSEIGWRKLKGLPEAIKVYKVIQDENSEQYNVLIKKWRSGNFTIKDDVLIERRSRPLVYFIGVVVLALAIGAVIFYMSGQTDREFNKVDDLINKGQALDALELLTTLKNKGGNPVKFTMLLLGAVLKHADYLAENRRYDDLDKFLTQIEEKYGALADMTPLRIKYKIAQIQAGFSDHDSKAYQILTELYQRYPENEEVIYQTALLNITQPDGSRHLARQALLKLLPKDNKYVKDQTFTDFAKEGMRKAYPFDHSGELARKIIENYYFQAFKDELKALLLSTEEYQRVNAFRILTNKKDLTPQEEFTYHWLTVINSTIYSDLMAEALAYFEKASRSGALTGLKKGLDTSKYGLFPILKQYEGKHTETARKIFTRFLMPELKTYFMQYAYSEEDSQVRVNSFRILTEAGFTKEIDLFKYHQANLMDIDPQYFARSVTEALEYMSVRLTGAEREQTLATLRQARRKLADNIERLKSDKSPKGYYEQGENILIEMDRLIQ